MKFIILLEKYGANCNRLFQSLHFHSLSIEENAKFINLSLLGNLKFDNNLFKSFDFIKNIILSSISKIISVFNDDQILVLSLNEKNYIKIVRGWSFRNIKLTKKHFMELSNLYKFKGKFSREIILKIDYLNKQKNLGRYLVAIHIRKGDYINWQKGKYFFEDNVYNNIIIKLKNILIENNLKPFFIVVSDQKISENIKADFKSNGKWREDQIILQNCDLLVGPPSTFTMWASYISQKPLLNINSKGNIEYKNRFICYG